MIDKVGKNNCTGCYACENICPKNCIDMKVDKEGFRYPNVYEEVCIKCEKCLNVCPILNQKTIVNNPKAYASYNKDERIRRESSSGGIFTLLSEKVIQNNGVVFGAKFDDKFDVVHGYTQDIKGLKSFRGSKYVQSKIGQAYNQVKNFLKNNRLVLFSGTPCQIAGLKSFLGKDYSNLICIDIICHGVPSPLAWDKYKSEISRGKNITSINFRDKTYGWKTYSFRIDFDDNTSFLEKGADNKYIRGFIGDIYLRPSCHNCKFKTLNRQSDITLADFWGIENIDSKMDDGNGTSLVIVNSKKGNHILKEIEDFIVFKEVDLNNAIKYNMSAIKSSYCNPRRKYFFKKVNKFKFDKLVNESLKESLSIRVKTKIYNIIKI